MKAPLTRPFFPAYFLLRRIYPVSPLRIHGSQCISNARHFKSVSRTPLRAIEEGLPILRMQPTEILELRMWHVNTDLLLTVFGVQIGRA